MADAFQTPLEWRIARELALKPCTQQELITRLGVDKKHLRHILGTLADRESIDFHPTTSGHVGRGHARGLWSLRGQRPSKQIFSPEEPPLEATWRPGQTWVAAQVTSERIGDLMAVLAEASLTAAASWVSQLDGDGRRVYAAFEGVLGSQPADRLLEAFTAAGIPCTTGTVRAVADPAALVAQAQSVQAQRATKQLSATRPSKSAEPAS